jgi:trans-aconitate methyltransferase
MNNWHTVWNKKDLEVRADLTLQNLIAVDGFDSSFGYLDEASWLRYVTHISSILNISSDTSIFEVGCGAGAFLYPFYQQGNKVSGIDYSSSLAKIAQAVMPRSMIHCGEAIVMPQDLSFDVVVANGVFFYFPHYEYAKTVLHLMLNAATQGIGIFDVPDLAKKADAIEYRKKIAGIENYEERYQDLDHLYFERDWFYQALENHPVDISIEDQNIADYGNSWYRYNVFITKK